LVELTNQNQVLLMCFLCDETEAPLVESVSCISQSAVR